MNVKQMTKNMFAVAAILFAAGFSGCKCCADETKAKNDSPKQGCNCPVLLITESDESYVPPAGGQPGCIVCTVWSSEYQPCMNAIAACPAQACKTLEKAPLCKKCKEKIIECAKIRKECGVCGTDKNPCQACIKKMQHCKVKDLMTEESMKRNRNCKSCMDAAKKDAKKCAKQMEKSCDHKNGKVANAKDPNGNANADDEVLVVEGEIVTITDAGPVNNAPATPASAPAKKDTPAASAPAKKDASAPDAPAPAK